MALEGLPGHYSFVYTSDGETRESHGNYEEGKSVRRKLVENGSV